MENLENIGGVKLNLKYYSGSDLYSDGEIENCILEIVKANDRDKYNELIFDRHEWAVMYHLSDVRENIVGTIELDKKTRVLEIGAGCGAVTGALAERAGNVTCVELSKKRSTINAYRNKDKNNIEILVGNFQDIEKELGQFDCITLIGVFEYAESYINAENPYIEFLKIVREHLSSEGKIVIAIENKLGLKYFAGCKEDHFGTYFEGIEDYTNTNGVRTFTRRELEKMFKEIGLNEYVFYYPYPDYKFPTKVFSDSYLPKIGELNTNVRNYDTDRMYLFNETKVFNTLIRENMFPTYSNSFLIEIGKADSNIIYKKYSNDRAKDFSICTDMIVDKGKTIKVRKYAACDKSIKHINKIMECSKMLKAQYEGSKLSVCESVEEDGKAVSEFITGKTLEEIADTYINEGRKDEAENLIKELITIIRKKNSSKDFKVTPEFEEVFGKVEFEEQMHTGDINDVDMLLTNIIDNNGNWKLIDYEWSFTFPVPVEFIIYRIIYYYLNNVEVNDIRNVFSKEDFIKIAYKDEKTFEKMENNFQKYVTGGRHQLRELREIIGKEVVDVQSLIGRGKTHAVVRLYRDCGQGYSEGDSSSYRTSLNESNKYAFSFEVEKGVKKYRFDPCECGCILKLEKLEADEDTLIMYHTNGTNVEGNMYIFVTDPWIEFEVEGTGIKKIYIEYSMEEIIFEYSEAVLKQLIKAERLSTDNGNLHKQMEGLRDQVENLQILLKKMETSTSWKVTKPLRSIKNAIRKKY